MLICLPLHGPQPHSAVTVWLPFSWIVDESGGASPEINQEFIIRTSRHWHTTEYMEQYFGDNFCIRRMV
jgi:hypothetical protein